MHWENSITEIQDVADYNHPRIVMAEQGREATKNLIADNPELTAELEQKIFEELKKHD